MYPIPLVRWGCKGKIFLADVSGVKEGVRLQKALAAAGVASRRACEELISAGRVLVNGRPVVELGTRVDPERDRIEVDGQTVELRVEPVYMLLNKPRGFVTTVRDQEGRRTVMDLLPKLPYRLYPVGRLDYDTEGLILLTNDGNLTFRLTHPRQGVPKTYLAVVEGAPNPKSLDTLSRGIQLTDGRTGPAVIKVTKKDAESTSLTITITEGRNRQVRRMFEAIGHPVTFLKRIRFGPLTLQGLRLGQYRFLKEDEIITLQKLSRSGKIRVQRRESRDHKRPDHRSSS